MWRCTKKTPELCPGFFFFFFNNRIEIKLLLALACVLTCVSYLLDVGLCLVIRLLWFGFVTWLLSCCSSRPLKWQNTDETLLWIQTSHHLRVPVAVGVSSAHQQCGFMCNRHVIDLGCGFFSSLETQFDRKLNLRTTSLFLLFEALDHTLISKTTEQLNPWMWLTVLPKPSNTAAHLFNTSFNSTETFENHGLWNRELPELHN